jgi:hypothetical protein
VVERRQLRLGKLCIYLFNDPTGRSARALTWTAVKASATTADVELRVDVVIPARSRWLAGLWRRQELLLLAREIGRKVTQFRLPMSDRRLPHSRLSRRLSRRR